jgi:endonuclease YncB( thermonuclease family)
MLEMLFIALIGGQPAASPSFACRVVRVSDGDTLKCATGRGVRLAAIDAPEMPGSCQPGRRCAPGDPLRAKAQLARLTLGRIVRCEPVGRSYDRVTAWCSVGGKDLSCAMVKSGNAIRYARHDRERRLCRS